jgi:hypothetical protein
VRLILVDVADRLRVSGLENLCKLFDRNTGGLVFGRHAWDGETAGEVRSSALKYPYTFYVAAALILFLGVTAVAVHRGNPRVVWV